MLVQLAKTLVVIAVTTILVLPAWGQEESKWKDRAEYDLYESIKKESDPNKQLAIIRDWKQKYANSNFALLRSKHQLAALLQLGNNAQPADIFRVAKEILDQEANYLQSQTGIVFTLFRLTQPTAEDLSLGERAAKGLLANMNDLLADTKKPQNVSDADWKKNKDQLSSVSHTALGWIYMQRKDYPAAQDEFAKSLTINPNNGQVSYWLGSVILAERVPEKQAVALYHIARASAFDGPGAYPEAGRKEVRAYLEKAYSQYHGDKSGLDQLLAQAKTTVMPPDGFSIKTAAQMAAEKEEEFKRSNPQLALWLSVKKELAGPNGEQYFKDNVLNAAIPPLKGKVISQTPAARPKEIVVGVADAATPEITLKLEAPLPTKADVGTEIEFEGIPTAFTADPFMLTMTVQSQDKISGWPTPAPARKKGGTRSTKKR